MTENMYDYAVIGAGPAGCFVAHELHKKNKRVIVFEKQAKGFRKVCGDGLSKNCVRLLKSSHFPFESLTALGAKKIEKSILIDGEGVVKEGDFSPDEPCPYGISRDLLDGAFQDWILGEGIELRFQSEVVSIQCQGDAYNVNGCLCKEYIVASGVYAKDPTTGIAIHKLKNAPIGMAMIVEVKSEEKPFFLFDRNKKYLGAYGWIFKLEKDLWNIGVWLKEDKARLKELFEEFVQGRLTEYLGKDYKVVVPPRTAPLAITKMPAQLYCIGDASGTCDEETGEGISQAIESAWAYADKII